MFKKEEKRDVIQTINIYDLENRTLDELIADLQNLKNDKYRTILIEPYLERDGGDMEGGLTIYGYRMETDEELQNKIEAHASNSLKRHLKNLSNESKNKGYKPPTWATIKLT